MSGTGTVATPASIGGHFDPNRTNYFCSDCRCFVQTPPGASDMRECPTPGYTNPTGFGIYWKTPRPTQSRAGRT